MTLEVYEDAEGVAGAAAGLWLERLEARPGLVVAVPAGRTPRPTYRRLREEAGRRRLSFRRTHVFPVDELVAPAPAEGYFWRQVRAGFLDWADVPPAQCYPFDPEAPDLAAMCGRVEARIRELGGLDLVLLGLGLSVLPAIGALIVAGFVFALALRGRKQPAGTWAFDALQLLLAGWALVSLVLLYLAIQQGLLFRPDMQVAGNGSTDQVLRWYADRVTGDMAPAGVFSLPIWVYRVAMLAWALWLAASLVRGIGPAWRAFTEGGAWRKLTLVRAKAPEGSEGPEGSGNASRQR